jgi:hypothetical protein
MTNLHARAATPALLLGALILLGSAAGAAPLALPLRETFVYTRTTGDKTDRVEMSMALKSVKGTSWYEYSSKADDEDAVMRLDPETLAVLWSEVVSKTPTTRVRRTVEVLEDREKPGPDVLVVTSTGPLLQRLRLIPFEARPRYRVLFLGNPTSSTFTLEVSVTGRETIRAAGRDWDCWRLEFGTGGTMGAVLGALMPKTRFWYAAEWPHVLVRSSGPASFPGSPIVTMELETYSGPAAAPSSAAPR